MRKLSSWFLNLNLYGLLGFLNLTGFSFAAAPVTELNIGANSSANSSSSSSSNLSTRQELNAQENQIQYIQSQLANLNTLQAAIADLRDQNQQLAHRVDELEIKIRTLETLEQSAPAARSSNNPTSSANSANPANSVSSPKPVTPIPVASPPIGRASSETQAYQQAYNLIAANRYDDAIARFNQFLTQYPASTQIPDANYWLGQLYLLKGQPDQATQEFRKVINFKNSPRVPDALRQLGVIYQANGDSAHAKQMFQRVVKDYPGTSAAIAAQKQIDSMN